MPYPFPGIDPYLENSKYWEGYHNSYIAFACEYLQPRLPAGYIATSEVRIYLDREDAEERHRQPDLTLTLVPGEGRPVSAPYSRASEAQTSGYWIESSLAERKEAYISIITLPGRDEVTTVELLSPTNKREGTGRTQYREKQARVQQNGVNFVEVDLLRAGTHSLSVHPDDLTKLPAYDYLAGIWRAARPWGHEVFAWQLPESLPTIPIPLLEGDPEAQLDLQVVHERVFAAGAFHRLLPYREQPSPRLSAEHSVWADTLLREAGLRGADA